MSSNVPVRMERHDLPPRDLLVGALLMMAACLAAGAMSMPGYVAVAAVVCAVILVATLGLQVTAAEVRRVRGARTL